MLSIQRIIPLIFILILTSCAPSTYWAVPPTSPIQTPIPSTSQSLVPFEPPTSGYRGTTIHEVAPLESLWRISKMYDVPQDDIMIANNLISEELDIGQKLTIPNAAPLKPVITLYPNPRWRYIVVHHTASEIGNAKLVDQWHKDRGFIELGYHFLIDNGTVGKLDGQIETSPRWIRQMKGAHTKAGHMNEKAIGVSLVGNFSNSEPSTAQMNSLYFLVRELMNYYRIPAHRVIGHRDAPGALTECPGTYFPWEKFKRKLRS